MFVALSCLCGTGSAMVVAPTSTSGPSGLSRWLINTVLASPLYKAVLVPQAKATMVKTAEKNGVPWTDALAWLESRGPWELPEAEQEGVAVPDYYREPFHAYESGNLCWEAALEGEIASRESPPFQPASRPSDLIPTWPSDGPTRRSNPLPGAVGARNFPEAGADGELAFRGAFDEALASLGAAVPAGGAVVDLGCGSGISTRRLAANWPAAASVLGLDLSLHFLAVGPRACTPCTRTCTCTRVHMHPRADAHAQATCNLERAVQVGRRLSALGRARAAAGDAGGDWQWVNDWRGYTDARVELRLADIGATGLPSGSVDVVSLSLVIHELPPAATREVAAEALRLLKPGGQLWVTEMDFETPGPHMQPHRARALDSKACRHSLPLTRVRLASDSLREAARQPAPLLAHPLDRAVPRRVRRLHAAPARRAERAGLRHGQARRGDRSPLRSGGDQAGGGRHGAARGRRPQERDRQGGHAPEDLGGEEGEGQVTWSRASLALRSKELSQSLTGLKRL